MKKLLLLIAGSLILACAACNNPIEKGLEDEEGSNGFSAPGSGASGPGVARWDQAVWDQSTWE